MTSCVVPIAFCARVSRPRGPKTPMTMKVHPRIDPADEGLERAAWA